MSGEKKSVYGAASSTGRTEDGKTSLGSVNEWSLVQARLEQFKSEDRLRLAAALKSYNDSLTERASLVDKNKRLARHNEELKMLLNIN